MTANVSLRLVESADIDIFYEHQADPGASAMAAFPSRDLETHRKHWTTRILVNESGIARTVVADGAVAGNVISWLDEDGRRLVGYWLGREFWGRGIATEALREYLVEVTERPLYAYVAATNVGSSRVLEKNGFVASEEIPGGDGDIEERLFVLN